MFALEVAAELVSTALHVKWYTVLYHAGQSWAPNSRNYICGCFNTSPEVVCPEAASHPEVRKAVIRGKLFKYLNIFIDAVWHVELCPSCVSTAQASLHLSSLEKSHGSISRADCPHVFPYRYSLQTSLSHVHPWGRQELAFLPFLLTGTRSTHWDYCERVALCLYPPSSFSACPPLHLQFPPHSHHHTHAHTFHS